MPHRKICLNCGVVKTNKDICCICSGKLRIKSQSPKGQCTNCGRGTKSKKLTLCYRCKHPQTHLKSCSKCGGATKGVVCLHCRRKKDAAPCPACGRLSEFCGKFCSYCTADNYKMLRDAVITFLGGKCKRCQFSDRRALQIDHVNGGGWKENRSTANRDIYLKIFSGDQNYQLLCANCNWIKRYENGEHRKKKIKHTEKKESSVK
jgi:hypothetical protein